MVIPLASEQDTILSQVSHLTTLRAPAAWVEGGCEAMVLVIQLGMPPSTEAHGVLNFVPSAPPPPLPALRLAALRLSFLLSPVGRVVLLSVPSWGKAGLTVLLRSFSKHS